MTGHRSRQSSPISAAVLAGGRATRLGRDKVTIELGGETLIQRAVRLVSALSDDVIVVGRTDQQSQLAQLIHGARILSDAEPFVGVLAGIASGLVAARHDWCLVVACDMPFVSLDLVRYMMSLKEGYDVVVPRLEEGLEPLLSLYHKNCLPALLCALKLGARRVVSFYAPQRVRYVEAAEVHRIDPMGRSFHNINVPEDLVRAQEWLSTGDASEEG